MHKFTFFKCYKASHIIEYTIKTIYFESPLRVLLRVIMYHFFLCKIFYFEYTDFEELVSAAFAVDPGSESPGGARVLFV